MWRHGKTTVSFQLRVLVELKQALCQMLRILLANIVFNVLDEVVYLLQVILLRFPSLLGCVASQQIELPNEISADLPKYALQQHVLSLYS